VFPGQYGLKQGGVLLHPQESEGTGRDWNTSNSTLCWSWLVI